MKSLSFLALLGSLVVSQVSAQSPVYGQCGGIGWTGATTCASGSVCTYSNAYYSQCLPGSAPPSSSTTKPSTTTNPPTTTTTSTGGGTTGGSCPGRTKFRYFGVNESGAEFGQNTIPGVLGTDYTFPSPSSIDYFMGKGFNTFRITFLMERLSPPSTGLTGPLNQAYLSGLMTIINYITGKGGYALLDPHNFMRYNGAVISSTSNFQAWWKTVATQFKTNSHVIFDVMNEPYGIDAGTVAGLNQAAINGIRSAGATSQLILLEGTSYTGAWTWTSSGNAAAFTSIKDPNNNFAIEMHQYLDSDGSGTSPTCVSSTIGAQRIADATNWLKANNLKGFLGEMGAGSNPTCISAVSGALCAMQQSGVWIGALWWAAGPWWGTYYQSIEPPNGAAIPSILPQALMPYL